MQKTYTLLIEGQEPVEYGSKKTAVKYGDTSGCSYRVLSPSGAVAHEVVVPETADEPEFAETLAEEVPTRERETSQRKFDLEGMKSKISKLLAKAEGTDNEDERDAFMSKAEALMLELGIHAAELEAAGEVKPEEIIEMVKEWHGNYSITMVDFTGYVAAGFGNLQTLHNKNHNGMYRWSYVIGHKSDVELFSILIDSLYVQARAALARWQREHAKDRRGLTDMQKYIQNRSFLEGFGLRVADRLTELRHRQEDDASTGAALVLASKQERITSWLEDAYPNLKTARGGAKHYSSVARGHGALAGDKADLGMNNVGDAKRGELD